MTAKKRWFKKIYSQSQDKILQEGNISISWSSSEEDEPSVVAKKPKVYSACERKCNEWIKQCNNSLNIHDRHENQHILQQESTIAHTSPSQNISDDSPIISGGKQDSWSPVLTQYNLVSTEKSSPILGKKNKFRKVKCRLNEELRAFEIKESEMSDDNSPDLFPTQESQGIHSISSIAPSVSPNKNFTQVVIEHSQVAEATHHKIEELSSQDSAEVLINSNSDETPSASKSEECLLLYKQPPPPKRKRLKKGGLCSQLQKVIRTQKSRIAIWQHENFLNKNNSILVIDKSLIIVFTVGKQWNEFGCIFYECAYYKNDETSVSHNEVSLPSRTDHIFILILSFNVLPKITYKIGSRYILYPPYSKKMIAYENTIARCYFNVSKIKKYKAD